MTPLLVYLAKVVICSGILYAYYYAMLRNNRFHQWNRYYLLLCTILSLTVPLLRIPMPFTQAGPETIYVYTSQVVTLREQVLAPSEVSLMATINWSTLLYGFVLFALLLRIAGGYWKILSLIRSSRVEFLQPYWLVLSEKVTSPFSFFRYIFWNETFHAETSEGRQMLQHEMVHLQERHSWDKLFMELVTAACWINPFFHLIKRELAVIHEFIADKKAVVNGDVREYAQSILQMALQSKHTFNMTSSFSHQPIKRRILMLTQSRNLRFSYLRRLLILPLAVFIFSALAFVADDEQRPFDFSSLPAVPSEPLVLEKPAQEKVSPHPKVTFMPPAGIKREDIPARPDTGRQQPVVTVVGYPAPPPPPAPAATVTGNAGAQDTTGKGEVFTFVEQPPRYPGGEEALFRYLNQSIKYPPMATEKGISGTVFVSFIVKNNGAIMDVRTVGTPKGGGLEEEAIRVVQAMGNWIPGKQNGRNVAVMFNLPIRFVLEKNGKVDKEQASADNKSLHRIADQMPVFGGGNAALSQYLSTHLRYPAAARNGKIQGNVLVAFTVQPNGTLDDVRIASPKLGGGLEEEALRVVKNMPAWKPAKDKGKIIPAEVRLPIAFRLQ
ncbi:TonB family protein [Chitinophaga lutea]|uniref:TonB family protein n=1 Tax=Chitinophaga lutea TaxID=2488634 RepID=A0A3N4Q4B3_9BACT|nr:M56 family metallopeptidase [Chitinophaga lutea]RPE12311.1 TonB family protein [Chitinophaga lutea]